MKFWHCTVCDVYYDQAKGVPSDDIAPGTPWEEVPEDWVCPGCGMEKEYYDLMELNPVTSTPAE